MSNRIKLFRMNDYDWVAAESAELANEWYKRECGLDDSEQTLDMITEEPLTRTFLIPHDEISEEELKMGFEIITYGNGKFARVPFSHMMEREKMKPPCLAGSTEW
ncbi:MAG: hypothetical protein FH756_00145 [Firmicutes bacterium]|nr:hypothetical protein [Bacillota bacterium]